MSYNIRNFRKRVDIDATLPLGHEVPTNRRERDACNGKSHIFSQLMDWMQKRKFDACVHRYGGNHSVKRFSCWEQFLTMAFAQLTYRESLRDIETCLRALQPQLYHAGFRTRASRSTIADANEKRNWRIHRDFAQILICRGYTRKSGNADHYPLI